MDPRTRQFILDLLADHNILSLGTVRADGYPQVTTVSYVNDGLTLYVGASDQAQKVQNIRHTPKVSLTIDRDYDDWDRIKGLSLGGRANIVADEAERRHAYELMKAKFPQLEGMASPAELGEFVVLKICPEVISVLDYTQGFGHSELVPVNDAELGSRF